MHTTINVDPSKLEEVASKVETADGTNTSRDFTIPSIAKLISYQVIGEAKIIWPSMDVLSHMRTIFVRYRLLCVNMQTF